MPGLTDGSTCTCSVDSGPSIDCDEHGNPNFGSPPPDDSAAPRPVSLPGPDGSTRA